VNKNIKNIKNDMKHQLNGKKIEMYRLSLWKEGTQSYNKGQLEGLKEDRKSMLIKKNQEVEFIGKNIELKRKSRVVL
jgi:hypothetical protein